MRQLPLISREVLLRIHEGRAGLLRSVDLLRRQCERVDDPHLRVRVLALQDALQDHIGSVDAALAAVHEDDTAR